MSLRPAFKLGQLVYMKADQDVAGTITGLIERPNATAYHYFVTFPSDGESVHYECELKAEKDFKAGGFNAD